MRPAHDRGAEVIAVEVPGGANAIGGCVVLDLSAMNQVLEIDPDNLVAVVQPGAVNNDVKAAVAARGLWYPPDPASAPWSTIGGNVATNAGGLCCLKYGVTRDYVLGLRAVVGGPVAVGAFADLVSSGQAVAHITRRGLGPAALELLDRTCLQAVEDWKHLGIEADAEALLLAQVDTPGDSGVAESAGTAAAMADAGALWVDQSTDDAEAEALFEARRLAYPALERLGPVLTEDVCVPRSKVPAMLEQIKAIAANHGVQIAAIALGGTVTGEHGVGIPKRAGMRRELAPGALALQSAVRTALDPLHLFIPAKPSPRP